MIGLGKVIYYNKDGSMDWLRTIVRSVCMYIDDYDVVIVASIAAVRAQRLYYKKTDIQTLFGRYKYHG